jgi:predicted aldo/keto reductase-like oxidoreductase
LTRKLATQLPLQAKQIIDQAEPKRTPAEWALRWVWNMPEISLLLSGMNAMDQVEENCRIAADAVPSTMTEQESQVIEKVKSLFHERIKIHCAACAYCLPCPSGVVIPLVFSTYNEAFRFDDPSSLIRYYHSLPPEIKADRCIACGECLAKCPHHIPIPEKMVEVTKFFEQADE